MAAAQQRLPVGVAETIGLRSTMEDCVGLYWNFFVNTTGRRPQQPQPQSPLADSCFGVFDGHGGHEVAELVTERLPTALAQVPY